VCHAVGFDTLAVDNVFFECDDYIVLVFYIHRPMGRGWAKREQEETMSGLPAVPLECLTGILDVLEVAVACMDLEGRVQVWNRASEELSGWTREEMLGSTVDRVVPPSGLEERRKVVARTLAEGQAIGTYTRVRKDGAIVHIEMRMHLIPGEQGEPHCIVALVRALPGHGVSLTPRQREVLGYVANGRTNDDIAGTLVVSRRTVERHVAAILDKFGVENRAAAAALAVAAGLAQPKSTPV
jgi:PAS domain S-box-containing protein